jgi:hypothetical protein
MTKKIVGTPNQITEATHIRNSMLRFIEPMYYYANSGQLKLRYNRVKYKLENTTDPVWFFKYTRATLDAVSALDLVNMVWKTEGWL